MAVLLGAAAAGSAMRPLLPGRGPHRLDRRRLACASFAATAILPPPLSHCSLPALVHPTRRARAPSRRRHLAPIAASPEVMTLMEGGADLLSSMQEAVTAAGAAAGGLGGNVADYITPSQSGPDSSSIAGVLTSGGVETSSFLESFESSLSSGSLSGVSTIGGDLRSVVESAGGDAGAAADVVRILINAVAELAVVCWLGITFIAPEDRDSTVAALSRVAFNLLFPSALFVGTARTAATLPLGPLAVIPALAIVQITCGAAVGWSMAKLWGLRDGGPFKPVFRQSVIASAFGNATTLPAVLMVSLSASFKPLAMDVTAPTRVVGYLSLYQLGWSLLLWTVGLAYLQDKQLWGNDSMDEDGEKGPTILERLASPPSVASLCGLITVFPVAADFLLEPSSIANPVFSAIDFLGRGAQPSLALVLALSLVGGAKGEEKEEEKRVVQEEEEQEREDGVWGGIGPASWTPETKQLAATATARGLVLPVVGLGVVTAGESLGVVPPDPVYRLIVLAEAAMPSAQVLVLLAQLGRKDNDDGGKLAASIARLLFLQYGILVVPVTLWIGYFLQVVYL